MKKTLRATKLQLYRQILLIPCVKYMGKDEGLRKLEITCKSIFTIRETLWKFLGNIKINEDLKNLTLKRHNEGKR